MNLFKVQIFSRVQLILLLLTLDTRVTHYGVVEYFNLSQTHYAYIVSKKILRTNYNVRTF